jgi:hypothetical protein
MVADGERVGVDPREGGGGGEQVAQGAAELFGTAPRPVGPGAGEPVPDSSGDVERGDRRRGDGGGGAHDRPA